MYFTSIATCFELPLFILRQFTSNNRMYRKHRWICPYTVDIHIIWTSSAHTATTNRLIYTICPYTLDIHIMWTSSVHTATTNRLIYTIGPYTVDIHIIWTSSAHSYYELLDIYNFKDYNFKLFICVYVYTLLWYKFPEDDPKYVETCRSLSALYVHVFILIPVHLLVLFIKEPCFWYCVHLTT